MPFVENMCICYNTSSYIDVSPVLQQDALVDVDGLLVVRAHVVDGGQAQLVLCHVLQLLVEHH